MNFAIRLVHNQHLVSFYADCHHNSLRRHKLAQLSKTDILKVHLIIDNYGLAYFRYVRF